MTMVPAQKVSKAQHQQILYATSRGAGAGAGAGGRGCGVQIPYADIMTRLPDTGCGYNYINNNNDDNNINISTTSNSNSNGEHLLKLQIQDNKCLLSGSDLGIGTNNHDHHNDIIMMMGDHDHQEEYSSRISNSGSSNTINEITTTTTTTIATAAVATVSSTSNKGSPTPNEQVQGCGSSSSSWLQLGLGEGTDPLAKTPPSPYNHRVDESRVAELEEQGTGLLLELNLGAGAGAGAGGTNSGYSKRQAEEEMTKEFRVPQRPAPAPAPIPGYYGISLLGGSSSSAIASATNFLSPHQHHQFLSNDPQVMMGGYWGSTSLNVNVNHQHHYARNLFMSSSSSSSISPSSSSTVMHHQHTGQPVGPYLSSPFNTSGSLSSLDPDFRVIHPPPRRPHSGIWFMLQPSLHQSRDEYLPQLSKRFLRIKDGRMTVGVVIKYVVNKLGLDTESQVEIRCRGQVLVPSLTLQHVRDQIWSSRDAAVTLLPHSSTSDHVMLLHYARTTLTST